MLRLHRPSEPDGFAGRVEAARAALGESLRARRSDKARQAHFLVKQIGRLSGVEKEKAKADLCNLGRAASEFAGMVRSIFEEKTHCRWRDMFSELG